MPKNDDPTEIEPRPQPSDPGGKPNVMHLRRDIEAGATGDKVPRLDPAASPVGTDAEAAGAPPKPAEVQKALRTERGPQRSPQHPADRAEDRGGARLALGLLLLGMLGVLAALIGRMS
jgi:hypothetical protein